MLKNNIEIINFLKSVSNVYSERGNEIIIHCPYCDDSLRPNARSHGHLYISTQHPVFHCFRCDTSGYLGNLLIDLGFTNKTTLKNLGGAKFLYLKEKSVIQKKSHIVIDNIIKTKNDNFKRGDIVNYNIFEKYIFTRLGGYCNYNKYLISPEIINNQLCAAFYNKTGSFVTARILNPTGNFRYIRNNNINNLYYFQDLDFDNFKSIVITEGVFDALSLYRFSDKFPKNKTFYISILGKNYGKTVNWIVSQHIPIGKYEINLIFDKDNKYYKKMLFLCKKIINRINPKITLNGYIPLLTNDVGEIPFIEKV